MSRPSRAIGLGWLWGTVLSLAANGLFIWAALGWGQAPSSAISAPPGSEQSAGTVRYGICGTRRCTQPEARMKRRGLDPGPLEEVEFMAELIPALGMKERDPRRLPELQTYREKEIAKSGVNLDRTQKRRKKLKKEWEEKQQPQDLGELMDVRNDDKRRRQVDLSEMEGVAHGEIGGAALERLGNVYLGKVRRLLRRNFRAPNLPREELEALYFRFKITQMRSDGAILAYRALGCGQPACRNTSFNAAAREVMERFLKPRRGEPEETFPPPEPELLRRINLEGLKVRLQGRDLS